MLPFLLATLYFEKWASKVAKLAKIRPIWSVSLAWCQWINLDNLIQPFLLTISDCERIG
jgi:hypothetical protein